MVDQRQKKKAGKKPKPKLTPRQKFMKAMSHPLRVRLLAYMNDRAWSPRELATELDEGLSQVSYHVTELKKFGLIELVRTEPVRGAVAHYYRAAERASCIRASPRSSQNLPVA